ncbi:ribosomal protein S29 [Pseudoscourfieldia marina]|eukprot:CAMPEP_0119193898 /NCGR_PEP_ID=MMETSP1316-20130426/3876_1 /TAXON_ID=41880 /ORGANISM="Pycnococcus provasolii, Strain RCC2336" /LENGTH=56 /DNA_ID=CAMNT_0007189189 /DNA_START=208 /DNA_END=378 /DNA_ORIENTATION=-
MGHDTIWNSHPKKYGLGSRHCRVCNNTHGLIRKYGLNICRQCFRQYAKDIGFVKYR